MIPWLFCKRRTILQRLLMLKAFVLAKISEITVSGSIVTFVTNMIAPLKTLVAQIDPVQSGTGDPSPDNIRPITGWTGCNISHSGEDTSNPTVYTVSFPQDAGTVYGGTLTVNEDGTGTLVVNKGITTIADQDWTYSSQYTRFGTSIEDIYKPGQIRRTPFITSAFISIDDGRVLSNVPNNSIYAAGNSTSVYIKTDLYTDETQFKSALGTVQIVYPLQNPVTYNLTELEVVETLKGLNNVWADTGDVTVTYYKRG